MMPGGDPLQHHHHHQQQPQQHHYHQQQQHHPPPPPNQQHQHQQPFQFGDFPRGPQPPPGPPLMMRQPPPSSNPLNANAPPPTDFHHPSMLPGPPPSHHTYDAHADSYGAKRMRKMGQRRAVDYTSTVVRYMQVRMWQRDSRDRTVLQATPAAAVDMLPSVGYSDNPSTSFAAKFVHTSFNKNRCSINRVLWTPTGRRLITGSESGEFTLWNGQSFNFEMILQAHDQAVRSMVWSYNDTWMVTGDDAGAIKYWQTNMNNVKANKTAHKESVRELSFCRTNGKFCSCSDDTTVKVWDFARCQEESSLTGHGWDVKSVDWHPTKSLLVSGGKDNLVKLWDAKSGRELCSFHDHKNTVLCVKWNQNGNWVLTASKDQIIKLYDIRAMKELESFRGHQKDVTTLAWHPFHEEYFVSGSYDGSIFHWLVGHETPQIEIANAHDSGVCDLAWHPIGYILCSGSNDHSTKFWCRNRPGDSARDKFSLNQQGAYDQNSALGYRTGNFGGSDSSSSTPGAFASGLVRNEGTIPGVGAAMPLSLPTLDSSSSSQGEQKNSLPPSMPLGAPPLPPGPHPSLLAANNQQHGGYNQNLQQMNSMPLHPLQPPSHMPMLQHPHLPRPPPQLQPGSMPMPMPGPMGMQGNMSQMGPPMPQGHFMGGLNAQPGGMPNGRQGPPPNTGSNQMFQPGGGFNRPQGGQMPHIPGMNPFQSMPSTFGMQSGMPPPLPPGPPPHGQGQGQ
ncbi:unnamed protein product [Cuscuta epithymum]|uniref:IFT140 first beta-propeller domain-containing protein n=1 Tax=Cuscuta epithymum TaxID=186058 RepID=A0AAV0EG32_9ASTE|nr:unnamed protein product [Cuscuta epithymum]